MIITFSGKSGSGKSTAAEMLSYLLFRARHDQMTYEGFKKYKESYNKFPNIHAFAEDLKKAIAVIAGIEPEWLDNQTFKKLHVQFLEEITYRELLQNFAESIKDSIDKDFWIKSLLYKFNPTKDVWIISDLRFKNELLAIEKFNPIKIKISRNDSNQMNHQSEHDLDDYTNFKFIIENNGSEEDLFNKISNIAISIAK